MLTKETVLKVAQLARLKLTDEQVESYRSDFEKILTYFEKIQALPTEGVAPLITPHASPTYFREDHVVQNITVDEIMKNAPETKGNLYKVPPVV